METIIGLLFILLPVILKLIGKKFEQSGQPEKAKKLQEFLDTISPDEDKDDEMEVEYDDDGQIVSVHPKMTWKPEPVSEPESEKTLVYEPEHAVKKHASNKKKPMLMEETPKKKSEKIDPKKMVIYSEIMKPKF